MTQAVNDLITAADAYAAECARTGNTIPMSNDEASIVIHNEYQDAKKAAKAPAKTSAKASKPAHKLEKAVTAKAHHVEKAVHAAAAHTTKSATKHKK